MKIKLQREGASFRNKYLALFILLSFSFTASAQYDSTRLRQVQTSYGFDYNNIKVKGSLIIPLDTFKLAVKDSGGIAYKGGFLWLWNGHRWTLQASGVVITPSSGIDSVTYSSNQLCQWVDGVSTCYRLNKFFDSTSYNFDSSKILFYNNGTVRDSIAGGRTIINLHYPLFWNAADSSINLKADSLPKLEYAAATRDTSTWIDRTLIDKGYLNQRISEIPTSSGTGGISKLGSPTFGLIKVNDSTYMADTVNGLTSKLRGDSLANAIAVNSSNVATNTTNITSNTTAIAGKADKSTTITINGTTQDLSANRSWTVSGGGSALDKQDSMNIYMPEKYKHVGDVGDDSSFIRMIADMPTTGGKVHLMSKTYIINSTVTIDKPIWFEGNGFSDSVMAGSGRKITVLKSGTNDIVLFRIVEDHVTFSNLRIESIQSTPSAGCAIRADSNLRTNSHIAGFNLDHVAFAGFYNQVEATGAYAWGINTCWFIMPANVGVVVSNTIVPDAGDSYITGSMFIPKNNNSFAGIYQTSSGGLRISNNKFNYNSSTKFKYMYYGNVSGTSDLLISGNSFENYTISAIKLAGPSTYFSNITIAGNQFSAMTIGTRPDIAIDSCATISIQGNVFRKGSANDTAILLTSVNSVNISNAYNGYGTPVAYAGTNSNIRGDGSGAPSYLLSFDSKGLPAPTSTYRDTIGVAIIKTKNYSGSIPPGYINNTLGGSQLTLTSNMRSGPGEIDFINSNIGLTGGFSFYQQTSSGTLNNLFSVKDNGNFGFGGITNPIAYVDIPAGTGTGNTGQIHLARGRVTNQDGYLSYDTSITGTPHLYFNINGTQQRLDSVVGGTGGAILADGTVPLTGNWNVNNHNISGVTTLTATTVSAGTVNAGTTIAANSTISTGASFIATQYNFGTGTPTGSSLTNGQPATSGTQVQNSLMQLWQGSVWNGSSANTVHYRAGVYPIAGTNTSEWKLSANLDAGSYTDVLKVKSDGTLTVPQYKLSALNTAPSSATDTGATGEIRITAGYIYVCVATNTWVRSALTTW